MSEHYDVAIIGAGTAGLAALDEVRKRTADFVLINDGPLRHHLCPCRLHAFQDAHRSFQGIPPACVL